MVQKILLKWLYKLSISFWRKTYLEHKYSVTFLKSCRNKNFLDITTPSSVLLLVLSCVWIPLTQLLRVLETFFSDLKFQWYLHKMPTRTFCQWIPETNEFWPMKWIQLNFAWNHNLSVMKKWFQYKIKRLKLCMWKSATNKNKLIAEPTDKLWNPATKRTNWLRNPLTNNWFQWPFASIYCKWKNTFVCGVETKKFPIPCLQNPHCHWISVFGSQAKHQFQHIVLKFISFDSIRFPDRTRIFNSEMLTFRNFNWVY